MKSKRSWPTVPNSALARLNREFDSLLLGCIDHCARPPLYWYFALGVQIFPACLVSFHASLPWAAVWNLRIEFNFDRESAAALCGA